MDLNSFLYEIYNLFRANQKEFNGFMLNYCIELYESGISDANYAYRMVTIKTYNDSNPIISDPMSSFGLWLQNTSEWSAGSGLNLNGLFKLNDYQFKDSELEEIELPNTLVEIGKGCFFNSKITRITIPDSVTLLKKSAFERCSQLTEVNLGKGLNEIKIKTFAFSQIKSIVVPEGVTRLKSFCFYGCTRLQHVKLPNSLIEIVNSVFSGCDIKVLIIPPNVEYLMCDTVFEAIEPDWMKEMRQSEDYYTDIEGIYDSDNDYDPEANDFKAMYKIEHPQFFNTPYKVTLFVTRKTALINTKRYCRIIHYGPEERVLEKVSDYLTKNEYAKDHVEFFKTHFGPEDYAYSDPHYSDTFN